jgi:hypothetical protein
MAINQLFKAACLGATAMYFLDPDRGRRRRALVRDQVIHLSRQLACYWDKALRDLDNRLTGVAAEIKGLTRAEPVSDDILASRVRSKLGRYVSHPRAIELSVHDGRVTLRGPVLASEAQSAFDAVRSVPGVSHVENEMQAHAEPGNISALQGGAERWGETPIGAQATWPPAACLGAAAGGLAALVFGLPRPTSLTGLLTGLGLALAATSESRSLTARRNSRSQPLRNQPTAGQTEKRGAAAAPHGPSPHGPAEDHTERVPLTRTTVPTSEPSQPHLAGQASASDFPPHV